MTFRWIFLSVAGALLLGNSLALAADAAKPAAKPATAQPATAPSKAAAPAQKPKPKPKPLNSATVEQLKTVPGVDDALAEKIVLSRPYPTRAYLVTKGVYSQDDYYKVKDFFVAVPPSDPKGKAKK